MRGWIHITVVGSVLGGILAGGLGSPSLAESPSTLSVTPIIHIDTGTYGGSLLGTFCDASARLRQQCDGRMRCSIQVQDTLCPSENRPTALLIPKLVVRYHCGDRDHPRHRQAEAPDTLRLACINQH